MTIKYSYFIGYFCHVLLEVPLALDLDQSVSERQ